MVSTAVILDPMEDKRITIEVSSAGAPGATQFSRRGEPVTVGLPLPRGFFFGQSQSLMLTNQDGRQIPIQVRGLDHWPDRSSRWVLLDFQPDVPAGATVRYELSVRSPIETPFPGACLRISEHDGDVLIETGIAKFRLRPGERFPFEDVTVDGDMAIDAARTTCHVEDAAGSRCTVRVTRISVEEAGSLRAVVALEGTVYRHGDEPLLELITRLSFFAGSAAVRFALTFRNPERARHPGGIWNLGDAGSVYVKDISIVVALPPDREPIHIRCSPQCDATLDSYESPLELYQDSSGGENWQSSNHLNRKRVVPNTFRGYRLRAGGKERVGLRATPIVRLHQGKRSLAVAMQYFWQNFPKAIEASSGVVTLRLFPRQYADVHEIQGGEQKTHTFVVAFGPDTVSSDPLAWVRVPLLARASSSWYCSSGALPYLTPLSDDANSEYLKLTASAIEGDDTFERKREIIDEYGWRHFGDIYGDHEAVGHEGPTPLVSHYNNQYDAIAGFAYQFLRSGDPRWWAHMNELAGHVSDIDVYHTDRDKAAYNHGLFWHTVHYVDAAIATHRSYPSAEGVKGGGPSSEHNYSTGLMLHHFLTGDPQSRATVIGLARFVLDMDDGRKTVFRWLDRGYTGIASASGSFFYHGPGRGPANSLNVLIDGHRLSSDPAFLAKAEALIRRCIHPADDIAARNLLDAERKWFYNMFLQALGRYLDYKIEMETIDRPYAYGRAALLHYARWMAAHEYPYLERPDILEFPTETWAAQDMRKSEVFKFAAKHASDSERVRFLERADFFFRSSTRTLMRMKTRTLARPVIILLSNGFMHAYFQQHPKTTAPLPSHVAEEFGLPRVFVPQKVRAVWRFRVVMATAIFLLAAAGAALLLTSLGRN